ncbi:hypothetical protein D3C80_846100 [compost metagenome]
MDDLGQAVDARHRLARRRLDGDVEGQVEAPVRLGHLLEQSLEVDVGEQGVAVLRLGRQLFEDHPAALGLLQDQGGVLGGRTAGGGVAQHLLGHDLDGGQRRAQLMSGGGGQAAQGRQPLFALQHVLGGGQGQLQLVGVGRHLPGVARGEQHPCRQGQAQAQAIEQRQLQVLVQPPRQGQGPVEEEAHGDDGHDPQDHRLARGQGGGGDGHRRHQQQAEGVGQAPGQSQQGGQLQDVEAQLGRRPRPVGQAAVDAPGARHGGQVHGDAGPDGGQAGAERQGEVQSQIGRQHG